MGRQAVGSERKNMNTDIDTSVRYEVRYEIIGQFVELFLKDAGFGPDPDTIRILGNTVGCRFKNAAKMVEKFSEVGWTHSMHENVTLVLYNSNKDGIIPFDSMSEVHDEIERLGFDAKDFKIFIIPTSISATS